CGARFAGHSAAVQPVAAHAVALGEGDAASEGGGAPGGDQPRRARPDHDDVVDPFTLGPPHLRFSSSRGRNSRPPNPAPPPPARGAGKTPGRARGRAWTGCRCTPRWPGRGGRGAPTGPSPV